MRKRKWISVDQLAAQLEKDSEYQRQMAAREADRQSIVAKNLHAAQPLVTDLVAMGFEVESPADLFNKKMDYRSAIGTLIQWMPRITNPDVKSDIARALSVEWAKPRALPVLMSEFKMADDDNLRWAIANALEVVADESVFPQIAEWARDARYGEARQMLVLALGHMRDSRVLGSLLELLRDEAVAGHAVIALGTLGDKNAIAAVEPFLRHRRKWVRDEARKSLRKLGS